MDWVSFLGIAGIAATIVVTLLGIASQRKYKYPSQLKYTIWRILKVLEPVPDSYKDATLTYNDNSVSQVLHYFLLSIVNERKSDVGNAEKDSFVFITLTESSKWVDVKIKQESAGVGSSVSISSERQVDLSFNLLKQGDYILI